jgi:hypothetical protein
MTLLAAAVALAVPYTTRTAPEWRVELLDREREPLAGFAVSESWQYSTFESALHWEARSTDANGWVTFPPRYVRASLAQRAYGAVLNARAFVHATWGPFVSISASPEGYIADAYSCEGLVGSTAKDCYRRPNGLAEHHCAAPSPDYQIVL